MTSKTTHLNPKVNYIFELIARQSGNTDENGKATKHLYDDLSPAAERAGLPPPARAVLGDPWIGATNHKWYQGNTITAKSRKSAPAESPFVILRKS